MKRCIFVFVLKGATLSVFAQSQAVQDSTVRSPEWTIALDEVTVSVQKRNRSSLEAFSI